MKSYSKTFKRSALSAAIALVSTGIALPLLAQEAASTAPVEEVIVTGIRQSLIQSADIKREAVGVVDAISAEDIGKFPDTNLAESLQRITGVSIDRSNNEGRQITVRGFGPNFNLVTLNGRTMPSSTALNESGVGRGFNFNELSSSSISAIEVYKTGRADLPTGGIGSTVNIRTAKPFDYDGFTLAGAVKANHDTTNETGSDVTPEFSFITSNTYYDGKFGWLVSGSYSERDSREIQGHVSDTQRADNGVGVDAGIDPNIGFDSSSNNNPNETLYLVRNFNLEVGDTSRKRTNAQFVLQFAPNENIEIDLDYTLSRFEEQRIANSTGLWFGFEGGRSGVARPDGVVNVRDVNQDIDFFGINQFLETHNDSIGINVDWQVNDRLTLNFDAHSSTSESQPDGQFAENIVNIFTMPLIDVGIDFIDGQDVPTPSFTVSQTLPPENVEGDNRRNRLPAGFEDTFDPSTFNPFAQENLQPDIGLQRGFSVENQVTEVKVSGQYDFDDSAGPLQNVKFGASYVDYEYDAGQIFNFVFLTGFDVSQVDFDLVPRGDIGNDFTGSSTLFPTLGFYDPLSVINRASEQGLFGTTNSVDDLVVEETTSLFVSADFETEILSLPFTANVGLRYEQTDTLGQTTTQQPIGTRHRSNAELSTVFADERSSERFTGDYDLFLPNINLGLDVTDDVKVRLSYSETVTRADIGQLSPGTTISTANRPGDQDTGVFSATRGNPGIEPSESENIDLSVEWYYSPGSYASIGLFDKKVSAFLQELVTQEEIIGADGEPVRNASAITRPGCPDSDLPACVSNSNDPGIIFDITRQINSDAEGSVYGVELAWQHTFEMGFGFILNYTAAGGDIEFDVNDFSAQDPLPLPGLSDSANAVLFYENEQFEVRLAYNWRDTFLTSYLGPESEPTFTESYEQYDLSASYNINDSSSIFIEGLNLTDETSRTHGRSKALLRDVFSSGPRFAIGYRAKL